jgi:MFS superfamily sulfate permease-like transporter
MKIFFRNAAADVPSAVVVFLVALPLCLGIALGSGAPLFSGIIAGIVGGIVIGSLSGSSLSVSGPAAGLTAIVAVAIGKVPVFEAFLLSVVIAGALQIVFGFLKAGIIGDYIPNSVIRGMLAAIGIILILKQLPHLVGYDKALHPGALIIGLTSIGLLLLWDLPLFKKIKQFVPGPLVVVVVGTLLATMLPGLGPNMMLVDGHYVHLPVASNLAAFTSLFRLPDWHYLGTYQVWVSGVTIALVASLETLLSIEAIDKLDPYNRSTPTDRELKAQGVGNLVSGLLGGLPITSVIVRSSANLTAGAKSRFSAIFHGILLLLSVLLIPGLLNAIPLSALAAILIMTGYKLAKPTLFREFHAKGWDQFVPFVVTIGAILLSDLLIGILIGIGVALFYLVRSNFRSAVMVVHDKEKYLLRFRKDVSFLNKPIVKGKLESVPDGAYVLIDLTRSDFIDKDVADVINEFLHHAPLKQIRVDVRRSPYKSAHQIVNIKAA